MWSSEKKANLLFYRSTERPSKRRRDVRGGSGYNENVNYVKKSLYGADLREALHLLDNDDDISQVIERKNHKIPRQNVRLLFEYAIERNDIKLLGVLLKIDKLDNPDELYHSAVVNAIKKDKTKIFSMLLAATKEYFSTSDYQLFFKGACMLARADIARILIKNETFEVDINYKYYIDRKFDIYETAIGLAVEYTNYRNQMNRRDIFKLLKENNVQIDDSDLQEAINDGLVEVVKLFGKNANQISKTEENLKELQKLNGLDKLEKEEKENSKKRKDVPLKILKGEREVRDPFNFGIELETCVIPKKYDTKTTKEVINRHFDEKMDGSIECDDRARSFEFVYRDTFKMSDLDKPGVQDAFNKISKISDSCVAKTCSTHIHMSHEGMTLREYPNFRVLLQEVWIEKEKDMARRFYKGQGRVFNDEYCKDLGKDGVCLDQSYFNKYMKLNLVPSRDKTGKKPIHVEFRGWGASIIPGQKYPFDKLKEYLSELIKIWNEAKERCKLENKLLEENMEFEPNETPPNKTPPNKRPRRSKGYRGSRFDLVSILNSTASDNVHNGQNS